MSEPSSEQKVIGGWPTAIFLAATFFAAIAPTLDWLEFGSSMENLVVATSMEVRRTNAWLVPTLEGPFDFVFSDADKEWYTNYFRSVWPKVVPGGCFTSACRFSRSASTGWVA